MKTSPRRRYPLREVLSVVWKTQRNVLITTCAILAGTVILVWGLYAYREHQLNTMVVYGHSERSLDDPVSEQRAYALASNFECVACGICNNMPLETCTCSFAVEARDLIRHEIVARASDESIIARVNEQFGGLEGMPSTQADSAANHHN